MIQWLQRDPDRASTATGGALTQARHGKLRTRHSPGTRTHSKTVTTSTWRDTACTVLHNNQYKGRKMQLRNMHQQACNVVQLCSMKPAPGTTHQQACNPQPPTRTALESVPVRRLPRRSSHLSCCSAETIIEVCRSQTGSADMGLCSSEVFVRRRCSMSSGHAGYSSTCNAKTALGTVPFSRLLAR